MTSPFRLHVSDIFYLSNRLTVFAGVPSSPEWAKNCFKLRCVLMLNGSQHQTLDDVSPVLVERRLGVVDDQMSVGTYSPVDLPKDAALTNDIWLEQSSSEANSALTLEARLG